MRLTDQAIPILIPMLVNCNIHCPCSHHILLFKKHVIPFASGCKLGKQFYIQHQKFAGYFSAE